MTANSLNVILQTLGVIGALGATLFAALSAKYGRDSILQAKTQDNPCIVVYVRQNPQNINIIELVIKNEGIRSARSINFKLVGDNFDLAIDKKKIKDIQIMQSGISLLAGGQEIIQPLNVYFGKHGEKLRKSRTSIQTEYLDSEGAKYRDSFKLDFIGLVNMQIGTPEEEKARKALEQIHVELNEIKKDIHFIAHRGVTELMSSPVYEEDKHRVTKVLNDNET